MFFWDELREKEDGVGEWVVGLTLYTVHCHSTSAYSSYAAGETTFTLKVSNVDYVKTVSMGDCSEYDIAIDGANNITVTTTNRED